MAGISLVSVNIERSKHLDTVIPFVLRHKPDAITLQECMEHDVRLFEKEFGMQSHFVPVHLYAAHPDKEKEGVEGTAILAGSLGACRSVHYAGNHGPLVRFTEDKEESIVKIAKILVYADVMRDGKTYRIATTHFTWSPKGSVTDLQREDLGKLFEVLQPLGGFVLTGDFNAPRGRAIWDTIAEKYKDNIPARYISSIDPMHRAGELPYVVDGLFTTPGYAASGVELHTGVSDHKAITATITKI